jgi:hypothetical protein
MKAPRVARGYAIGHHLLSSEPVKDWRHSRINRNENDDMNNMCVENNEDKQSCS